MIPPRERCSRRPCNIHPFISDRNGGTRERVSCPILTSSTHPFRARRRMSVRSGLARRRFSSRRMSRPRSTECLGCRRARLRCHFWHRQGGCLAGERQNPSQEWLCHRGWESLRGSGKFAEISTRNGLDLRYKVFARRDYIFAGRWTLIGRKVRPPSRSPTRALVLAKTNHCSQFALCQDGVRRRSEEVTRSSG